MTLPGEPSRSGQVSNSETPVEKPSIAHVIWQKNTKYGVRKRFDFQYLRLWASQFNLSYAGRERVDEDRALAPRPQHLCVFFEEEQNVEGISVGDDTWDLAPQSAPRTFIEIDEGGLARIQRWNDSDIYNIIELILDKYHIVFRTKDDHTHQLDIRDLTSPPSKT